MLRGLWKLTWVEFKIFAREPMGLLSTVAIPVLVFLVLGRILGGKVAGNQHVESFIRIGLPVFACILMAFSAATSLIAIISIYRESGILKRLKATPLRPQTILASHVVLKLALTAATLGLLVLAGKRFYPIPMTVAVRWPSITLALLLATLSILSIGFVIASAVPTARFAQPIASLVFYPLLAISGMFFPIEALPPFWHKVALLSPITHAASLLDAAWTGEPWSAHLVAIGALLVNLFVCTAVSVKIFRWE